MVRGTYPTLLPPAMGTDLIFVDAATDFRYLLSRGYSRIASLSLVVKRYQLDYSATLGLGDVLPGI